MNYYGLTQWDYGATLPTDICEIFHFISFLICLTLYYNSPHFPLKGCGSGQGLETAGWGMVWLPSQRIPKEDPKAARRSRLEKRALRIHRVNLSICLYFSISHLYNLPIYPTLPFLVMMKAVAIRAELPCLLVFLLAH